MIAQPNWDRAKTLFHRALDMNASDRAVLLDVECATDEVLRREVDRLLDHHGGDDSFMRPPEAMGSGLGSVVNGVVRGAITGDPDTRDEPDTTGDRRFGRYHLLDEIGRGGMGVVYRARQDQPRREVAVKILPPTLASPRMMRRFELEADLLGRLCHRGIARIYDAGTVAGSLGPQAYFAMELIDGRPIDVHAKSLSIRDRLELIARVCDAVHHAHQHGVIHRDLKPANILVDDTGHPVVLDFGVARAIDENAASPTLTNRGGLIGTLAYMSPEQLDGVSDTRSDVYALGLIAHKLLAGSLPYRVDDQPIDRAMGIIRSMVPPRLGTHDRALGGDIETIVAHAIEKDPDRRYDSPAAMARDIRRALAHQPIAARKATSCYQLSLVVRRHRVLAGLAAIVLTALIAWTTTSVVQMARRGPAISTQASLADRFALDHSTAHYEYLDILAGMSDQELRDSVDLFIATRHDSKRIDRFAAECHRRGMMPEALRLYQAALERSSAQHGLASTQATRQLQVYAGVLIEANRFDDADRELTGALQREPIGYHFAPDIDASRVPSAIHSTTLRLGWTLAEVHQRQGQIARAEREYRVVLADQFRMYRDHTDWLETLDNLVWLLVGEGRIAEAEAVVDAYLNDPLFDSSKASEDQNDLIELRIMPRLTPKPPVYYSLAATGNAAGLR